MEVDDAGIAWLGERIMLIEFTSETRGDWGLS
jgi:hypothetical protein